MKKARLWPALGLVVSSVLISCGDNKADASLVHFKESSLIQSSYGGLGVEWGVYEDTDKLSEESIKRIYKTVKKLNPARIRCMINYDWFLKDFDDKGDKDKTNDTWAYDYSNKWGVNMAELLTYCQVNSIDVAFGSWNVVGTLVDDVWNMMEESTSDVRWAKIFADVMDYLVNKKGFTCIRWFVNGNEPNYLGVEGSSKNWGNSLTKWTQGVKNVRAALDEKGLNSIGIVGGDTTGLEGTDEYWTGIASNIPDYVNDYGAHLYLTNYYIDGGTVQTEIEKLNKKIYALDSGYGTKRPLDIWESGLQDGKNAETDGNRLIKTVTYGVRMADFTIQTALAGVNSVVYWDFDDAQNFIYSGSVATPKRWGMFSSLSSDQAFDQELRPWFHSSSLLTNLMAPGSLIYAPEEGINDASFRAVGVASKDGANLGLIAVNRGTEDMSKSFWFDKKETSDEGKLYIYTFGEGLLRIGEDGFLLPNYTIDGTLSKKLTVKMKPNTLLVVSSKEL